MQREGPESRSPNTAASKAKGRGPASGTRSRALRVDKNKAGIKKQYLKTRKVCKVTFRLPGAVAKNAERVCVVGDFNDWNVTATPMKKCRNQDYAVTLELEPGREYQFRYLIDGATWENDWHADKYVKSPFGDAENSVVTT
ncbi:MAG: isoamylase early set domain-containing protein [Deltaproteobacteria bacterium]|nr:isoamylase early set domain-containing protein [Deltaproteobacteria bacterium]